MQLEKFSLHRNEITLTQWLSSKYDKFWEALLAVKPKQKPEIDKSKDFRV
jgi:hypothetical protein